MPKKRKTFPKTEWTDYENSFFDLCQQKNWKPDTDEDGSPVLLANRSKDCYKVYAHAPGIYAVCIMAEHGNTKKSVHRKLVRANIIPKDKEAKIKSTDGKEWPCIFNDGDTEAIILFSEDRLPRAVKTLNLRRKKKHAGPSQETIAKAQKALAEYHARRKRTNS